MAQNRPLTREQYDLIFSAADSFEQISSVLPTLQNILNCQFVDDTFEAINEKDCPKLKSSTQRLSQSAIASAVALTIAAFYFCVCIRCVSTSNTESWLSKDVSILERNVWHAQVAWAQPSATKVEQHVQDFHVTTDLSCV